MKVLKTGVKAGFTYRWSIQNKSDYKLKRGSIYHSAAANYPRIKKAKHLILQLGKYEIALWWSKDMGPNPAHEAWQKKQDESWLQEHTGRHVRVI